MPQTSVLALHVFAVRGKEEAIARIANRYGLHGGRPTYVVGPDDVFYGSHFAGSNQEPGTLAQLGAELVELGIPYHAAHAPCEGFAGEVHMYVPELGLHYSLYDDPQRDSVLSSEGLLTLISEHDGDVEAALAEFELYAGRAWRIRFADMASEESFSDQTYRLLRREGMSVAEAELAASNVEEGQVEALAELVVSFS